MKTHNDDHDIRTQEREQQRLRLERRAQQQQRALDVEIVELVRDFRGSPEQIGRYLAELNERGLLKPADVERLYDQVRDAAGATFADRAFGRQAGARTTAELLARFAPAAGEAEGAPPDNVIDLDRVRADRTARLVQQLAGALGISLDDLTVRSDDEARRRTEARGARGLMEEGQVFLHPQSYDPATSEGRYLLGHEVAHVAQQRQTGARSGEAPIAHAEAEAATIGQRFASGQTPGRATAPLAPSARAADTGAAAAAAPAAAGTATRPESLDLDVFGHPVHLSIPRNDRKTVRVVVNATPMPGLQLNWVEIEFDESWHLKRGTADCTISVGEYVHLEGVRLTLSEEQLPGESEPHIEVRGNVTGAAFQVGELIEGTLDLSFSSGGISGHGTITHAGVHLHEAVTLTGGSIDVTLGEDGEFSARGTVTGEVAQVGRVTFEAGLANGQLSGAVTVTLAEPLELVPDVTLDAVQLAGQYSAEGLEVSGTVDMTIAHWVGLGIVGRYNVTTGEWGAAGTLTQQGDIRLGELEVTNSSLTVQVDNNALTRADATATVTIPHWQAVLTGSYVPEDGQLSGRGEVTLTEELALGTGGAVLKEANATATVEANRLVRVQGGAMAEFPLQGEPTFRVTGTDLTWVAEGNEVSGQGQVETLRELTVGSPGGLHATIASGASGTATVEANRVTAASGGLIFSVAEGEREVGTGTVDLNFAAESGGLSGRGTFTLTNDFGMPDREAGPFFLRRDSTIIAVLTEGRLSELTLENVGFGLTGLGPEALGVIGGTINGTLSLPATGASTATGSVTAAVETGWHIAADWGDVEIQQGGNVLAQVTDSELTLVELHVPLGINVLAPQATAPIRFQGNIDGTYVNLPQESVSGTASVRLVGDTTFPLGETGDSLVVKDGATATAEMASNALERLTLGMELEYHRQGSLLLAGRISDGVYTTSDHKIGLNGNLTLKAPVEKTLGENSPWKLVLMPEVTTLDVVVEGSRLTRMGGSIQLELHDGTTPLLRGSLMNAELQVEEMLFSGDLDVRFIDNFSWPRSPEDAGALPPAAAMRVMAGSHVSGRIDSNTLSSAQVELDFQFDLAASLLGTGRIEGSWNVQDDKVDGEGRLTLARDLDIGDPTNTGEEPAGWALFICQNASVAVKIGNNRFEKTTIDVPLRLKNGRTEVATGSVNGEYLPGEEGGFSGQASFQMVSEVLLKNAGRLGIYLGQGTHATATVAHGRLTEATGDFELLGKEGETRKLELSINTTYREGAAFNGVATLRVVDSIRMGGSGEWGVHLDPGTTGTVRLENSEPRDITGEIWVSVSRGEEMFARGHFSVNYDFAQGESAVVDAEGSVELIGQVTLGSAAGYTFTLNGGTGLSAKVTRNALEWVEGQLVLGVGDPVEFGTLALSGRYEAGAAPSFSGQAAATITRPKSLGLQFSGYDFWLMPSLVTVDLLDSDITHIGGQIGVQARKAEGNITLALTGDWVKNATGGTFNGTGSGTVEGQVTVGSAGAYTFIVQGGSGLDIHVENNEFTRIHGTLNALVKEGETDFFALNCMITYRTADGGSIDADGSCSLLGEKKVFQLGTYEFWLRRGSGFTATIKVLDNDVKEVGGVIAFMIKDGQPLPLIVATASGRYTDEDGYFTGEGDIRLGRPVTFPPNATSGPKLEFHAGSGGRGQVTNSELRRLGGNLNVDVWDSTGALVNINADGEYDVVNNNLVRLAGNATMMRSIEIGGTGDQAMLRVLSLTGHAVIENSELVSAGGSCDVVLPRLNNMRGHFEANWRTAGGQDFFSGSGTINFVLFPPDPQTGRSMSGEVSATYNEDGSFVIDGDVDYNINHMLGGTLGVHVDQTLQPVLSGTIRCTDVPLVRGRPLFDLGIDILPKMSIPIFPPVGAMLDIGIRGGLGLGMQDLRFSAEIGIDNFRPLADHVTVPDFHAQLALSWGLDFHAFVAAYMGVSVGVPGANLGAGVEGEVRLNAPLTVTPSGLLRSEGGRFSGELGVGVSIEPTLDLYARPYLQATLGAEHRLNLDEWHAPLGSIFRFEWGTTYQWGDQGSRREQRPADQHPGLPAPTRPPTPTSEAEINARTPNRASGAEPVPGGPSLESGSEMASQQQSGRDAGPMGEIQQKIDRIQTIAEGVGACARLLSLLIGIVTAALSFGPIGVVIYLAWKAFKGEFSFSQVARDVAAVVRLLQTCMDLIQPYLPDWWDRIIGFFSGDAPSLLDALFGADDAMRRSVRAGEHRHAPPEVRASMIDEMISGYTGEDDQECILEVLRFSSSNGDIAAVVRRVDGGADQILDDLDGYEDDQARILFRRNGITW
ncbi:MAG: DUF4157 domain-containing protein [Deltaproteobacteria bacterium]|nr:DUF4157 domain-containing protein [Deltaproteobacteria bacterium]MCB9788425.1 DUF4157 domain-containing protein [Deltaproteobacteria bacterium]